MLVSEIHRLYATCSELLGDISIMDADQEFEEVELSNRFLNTDRIVNLLKKIQCLFTFKMHMALVKQCYEELSVSREDIVITNSLKYKRFEAATSQLFDFTDSNLYLFSFKDFDYVSDDESVEEERGVIRMAKFLKIPSALRCLDLQTNDIGYKGARLIADALKFNFNLEVLCLSHNEIGDDGAFELASMLRINSTLKELILDECLIGDKGIHEIASALVECNNSLEVLDISSSCVFILAASELSKALKSNNCLRTLVLRNCLLTDQTCTKLMEGVLTNTSLESIDLSHNNIRNRGAQSIAKVLKKNEILTELFLANNNIRFTGIKHIANSISKSNSIQKLQIQSNLFGEEGVHVILGAVLENKSLVDVCLRSFDYFNYDDAAYCMRLEGTLAETLERNRVLRFASRKFFLCAYTKRACKNGGYILDHGILCSILFPMISH